MLTEKEKLQRAKLYMLKLSSGIDPITNKPVGKESELCNERLKKCFSYVADVLDGCIKEKTQKSSPGKRTRQPFFITTEQIEKINLPGETCTVSQLAEAINTAAAENECKKLKSSEINDWLEHIGYLQTKTQQGRSHRALTGRSQEIGITAKQGIGAYGSYDIILYSEQTQRFICERINDIIKFIKEREEEK